jgi:transposase-like protein
MVQRLLLPNGPTQIALAAEVGVPQTTLSNWKRRSDSLSIVSKTEKPGAASRSRRPEDWTAQERLRIVMQASGLAESELGELLRREGLHEETLEAWRKAVQEAALDALQPAGPARARGGDRKKIKQLERELARKEKALAEAAALLVLKKKVQAIWGDEDDDTSEKNDK